MVVTCESTGVPRPRLFAAAATRCNPNGVDVSMSSCSGRIKFMQITWRHSHMYMVWFFRMQFPLRKYVKLCICLFHTVTMQGLHPHLVTPHPGHARIIFQHKAGRSPCGGFKHLRTEHLQDIVAIVHVSFRCGIFKSILSPLPIILSIFRSEHGLVHFNVRCFLNGSSTGCILPVVVLVSYVDNRRTLFPNCMCKHPTSQETWIFSVTSLTAMP